MVPKWFPSGGENGAQRGAQYLARRRSTLEGADAANLRVNRAAFLTAPEQDHNRSVRLIPPLL
jgi:hypothetical protein